MYTYMITTVVSELNRLSVWKCKRLASQTTTYLFPSKCGNFETVVIFSSNDSQPLVLHKTSIFFNTVKNHLRKLPHIQLENEI